MKPEDQNQSQEPNEKPLNQQETADALSQAAKSTADAGAAVGDALKSVNDVAAAGTIDTQPGPMLSSAEHGGQAQETGPANLAPAQAAEETPQQMFDRLVARKKALWVQIAHLDHEKRSLTATQKEIDDIDRQLMAIWKTYPGQIQREEDK